ncbi:MAG: GNAT family N-acetyltransferase [Pseudomonadota bacterium]|nr:GNAT family N-acetyltransferase [Pseudomonadota bacterium]
MALGCGALPSWNSLKRRRIWNCWQLDPSYRRAGLGRRLVRWLEESCTVAGSFVVYLEVRASNPGARAFYQALGYRCIAQVPRYYQGIEAAIRMARDLSAG